MEYALHVAVLFLIYAVLAASLDLLVGYTGVLSLAHASFFGVGSYSAALVSIHFGGEFFPLGVAIGMGVAAILSVAVALPSFRLHEDFFVLVTLAFQYVLWSVFNNWQGLTGGPLGLPGIPAPWILGWQVGSRPALLVLGAALAAVCAAVLARIVRAPYGRVLRALREDEVLVRSLGKNVLRMKIQVFVVSGMMAAAAGSVFAHYLGYIDPLGFTVAESILVLAMVILGGAGTLWGPVVGAAALVLIPEVLRFLGLPAPIAGHVRQIAYGVLLVILMVWRPAGIAGEYRFDQGQT